MVMSVDDGGDELAVSVKDGFLGCSQSQVQLYGCSIR